MAKTYYVIESGKIVNAIVWDGVTPWDKSVEVIADKDIPDQVGIGATLENGVWVMPDNVPIGEEE